METSNKNQKAEKKTPEPLTDQNADSPINGSILNTIISVAGAVGIDYILFIKPLKEEFEKFTSSYKALQTKIAELETKNKETETKLTQFENQNNTTQPDSKYKLMEERLRECEGLIRKIAGQLNNLTYKFSVSDADKGVDGLGAAETKENCTQIPQKIRRITF